ncbi:MAG: RNase adapter RapZ [Candidatus Eremiobacteraeota bacterium]|nr:RNase adapter RapZ [Candidatus Eremiobacteraeota bacterium]
MNPPRIVFVAGPSGAGQSQAMKSFEDLGFYCIEHLPPVLLDAAVESLTRAGTTDIAIALDVRGGRNLGDPFAAIDDAMRDYDARLLFLDAHDGILVRRFSTTRRRHPFQQAGSMRAAIAADRRMLAPLRERANLVIDTSALTHAALKERIAGAFASERPVRLSLVVVAFGFKFGLPTDLDLLFDVRFLRNPNYVAELAALTGDDAAVAAFIEDDPALEPFVVKTADLLDFLLPLYVREGKTQVTLGIGCTGGRHRSVYVARRLLERVRTGEILAATFEARDLGRT